MSKVKEALERYMTAHETPRRILDELIQPDQATLMLSGEAKATLYEATVLAAYFRTSVREFFETK